MNTKYLYFFVAAVIVITAGCRSAPTPVLSASPTLLGFGVTSGESQTFEVTSNVFWTISDPPAWLDVSPNQGKGGIIKVTVTMKTANLTDDERVGKLIISAASTDVRDVTVTVNQDAPATVDVFHGAIHGGLKILLEFIGQGFDQSRQLHQLCGMRHLLIRCRVV